MKYSVIHSNDPYLLARMATDLQMEGVEDEQTFTFQNPFHVSEHSPVSYLHTCKDNTFSFQNHGWCPVTKSKDRHELTESNYLDVLEAVLS